MATVFQPKKAILAVVALGSWASILIIINIIDDCTCKLTSCVSIFSLNLQATAQGLQILILINALKTALSTTVYT